MLMDWKKLFMGVEDQSLGFFPAQIQDGCAFVKPDPQVFVDGIEDWKNALVGQFIGSTPSFSALYKIVEMLWRKSSLVKLSIVASNLYVFKISNSTARDWVIENGPWHIQHKSLVLRKWEPSMAKLDFDLVLMPVWVQLFNIPLELFSQQDLSYIASAIGNPLYMDSVTANKEWLEFAKVSVEVKPGDSIPKVVNVLMHDGSLHAVRVLVPWMPPCCSKCNTYGHSDKICSEGLPKPSVKVWKRKHVVPVEGVGLIHEIGESSHSVEVLVQNRVEADVEVVMQSLDQLAESVVGKVDGEKEALGAIGSGGVVEVREDGAQLAFVEPNDQEFPSLHES
ncbi:hypothetical protein V6N13_092367 [Hibiscus sabdariffa]